MKLTTDIDFVRCEDANGYATYFVVPGRAMGWQQGEMNLLRHLAVQEWSRGSGGGLNHYTLDTAPQHRSPSVWRHTLSLTQFDDLEKCKASLVSELERLLAQFVNVTPA